MEPRNKQLPPLSKEEFLFSTDNVASNMDCTGLIPFAPEDDFEAEAYTDIYAIPQPENNQPDGLQHT
ncbi:hypothetical protein [Anaeromassilibacillus senegalensis]|uniref:hypothetical protein n=1 Tax=Anaeromassilibacillus senegalensis TaxID=1673717 RepID=UPI0006830260|nr:hypothetical protein [Anaeromassilibacillus senegalensis]